MVILLMSGLAIFNGWPALYWGIWTQFDQPLLPMYAIQGGSGQEVGIHRRPGHRFVTTGWLGLSPGPDDRPTVRGCPAWATLPGPLWLAKARRDKQKAGAKAMNRHADNASPARGKGYEPKSAPTCLVMRRGTALATGMA